jgi:fused signal recognition particle receptor
MVFARLREGLTRTRNRIAHAWRRMSGDASAPETVEALEELLYAADVGPLAGELLREAEAGLAAGRFAHPRELGPWLRGRLAGLVRGPEGLPLAPAAQGAPTVVLVVGVNGSGKTTSIAKLVHHLRGRGHGVMVAACDTFRAAAVEQLAIWCERAGVPLVRGAPGADPASVAHDAAQMARAQRAEYLVVDTAGRLHTQKNLMQELEKIGRVLGRVVPGAPHHTVLILDGTTGQNAIQQARKFGEAVRVTGVVLTKLDGTAKGGATLSVGRELGLPVLFVGVGEGMEDLEIFDPVAFVDALLEPQGRQAASA